LHPPQVFQALPESRKPGVSLRIGVGVAPSHHDGKPPHALAVLRARRERPRRRTATKEHDELATIHSITSSARASSIGEISRPSALAVARLITSSKRVGCTTGRSAGFAPLRMRPV